MSGGLAALLDDVAAIAKIAAASVDDVAAGAGRSSTKAAGVIIDDAAVTPRYVQGMRPNRELPMIRKIAVGSLRNKLLIILPILLLLSQFVPWILTPLLMLGGLYLCYEGVEKVWEKVNPHHEAPKTPAAAKGEGHEKKMVSGAIRTDFILSAEIMVISLNEVADVESVWMRGVILLIVGILITVVVYGAVALIVKMDDVGLHLVETKEGGLANFGHGLVKAMPVVMSVLSTVGIAAMIWVGGHILLVGFDELGWHAPYELVHGLEVLVAGALGPVGGFAGWLVNTIGSAILGLIIGGIAVVVMHLVAKLRGKGGHGDETEAVEPEGEAGAAETEGKAEGTEPEGEADESAEPANDQTGGTKAD
ncbi:DUF808 domain-containing protein [Microlunatus sp. Y2014]|uniref:DUF808 domain-containing protein n=1 Tax=Microlunatus sp. Y2014 TaxID=3418488 RepID=UPI003DA717DF